MNEQKKTSALAWWIGGALVVVLSGVAAYWFTMNQAESTPAAQTQSQSSTTTVAETTNTNTTDTTSSSSSATKTGAVTDDELTALGTSVGDSVTAADVTLKNYDSAASVDESVPSL